MEKIEHIIAEPPIYIGIHIKDEDIVKSLISECFNQTFKSLGSTDTFISTLNMSLTADQDFVFPPDFHVTLSFFGGDLAKYTYHPLVTSGVFQEDQPVSLSILAFVIAPSKIMTALVKINDVNVTSDNEFAHITLMVGQWKPVQSNFILKALFNEKYGLMRDLHQWLQQQTEVSEDITEKVCVNMGPKEGDCECYIVVPAGAPIEIEGYMKSYFSF